MFINPNTSEEFTKRIESIVKNYALPTTTVAAANPKSGPKSIESIYDELLSCQGTLELAITEMDNFDAFVIACYSDHPTIYALRELTDKPVMGIAEASMYTACMIGYKFSIVTTNEEWEPLLIDSVRHYGLIDRCASVRSTRMPVLALESANPEDTYQMILKTSQKAIAEDDAEVICLGCAGMTGLDKRLERELKVPVLDGVVCALKFVEGFVSYGVKTSKKRVYAKPQFKPLVNIPKIFEKIYNSED